MDRRTPHFTPLRLSSVRWRVGASLLGPLAWVAGFALLAVVASETRALAVGMMIAVAAFALAFALLVPTRRMRIREEREADAPSHR